MGYRGDDRGGDDRWRDREQGRWNEGGRPGERDYGRGQSGHGGQGWNEGRREASGWGPGLGDGRGGHDPRGPHDGGEDRGFFERASEGVRSFFGGGDEDQAGAGGRWNQERGRGEHRDNGYGGGGAGTLGGGGFGGGWGNQAGESWNRDRPGERGWFTDSVGGERGVRRGADGGSGEDRGSAPTGPNPAFGYMPITGNYSAADHGRGRDDGRSGYGSGQAGGGQSGGRTPQAHPGNAAHIHDPHYAQWRQRQVEELDRDYEEYRREHQSKFEQEFGSWRSKRQSQRQMVGGVKEQMEVVGSDGAAVGTVGKVHGDRIILTKSDANAGGLHHSIPCSWVESVEGRVTLNRTSQQALAEWREEEQSRALFERQDSGSDGPHVLNRSFSGTYKDGDE
jgi:hypothetical protein